MFHPGHRTGGKGWKCRYRCTRSTRFIGWRRWEWSSRPGCEHRWRWGSPFHVPQEIVQWPTWADQRHGTDHHRAAHSRLLDLTHRRQGWSPVDDDVCLFTAQRHSLETEKCYPRGKNGEGLGRYIAPGDKRRQEEIRGWDRMRGQEKREESEPAVTSCAMKVVNGTVWEEWKVVAQQNRLKSCFLEKHRLRFISKSTLWIQFGKKDLWSE